MCLWCSYSGTIGTTHACFIHAPYGATREFISNDMPNSLLYHFLVPVDKENAVQWDTVDIPQSARVLMDTVNADTHSLIEDIYQRFNEEMSALEDNPNIEQLYCAYTFMRNVMMSDDFVRALIQIITTWGTRKVRMLLGTQLKYSVYVTTFLTENYTDCFIRNNDYNTSYLIADTPHRYIQLMPYVWGKTLKNIQPRQRVLKYDDIITAHWRNYDNEVD